MKNLPMVTLWIIRPHNNINSTRQAMENCPLGQQYKFIRLPMLESKITPRVAAKL